MQNASMINIGSFERTSFQPDIGTAVSFRLLKILHFRICCSVGSGVFYHQCLNLLHCILHSLGTSIKENDVASA